MKSQITLSKDEFSSFLDHGAIYKWQDQLYLYWLDDPTGELEKSSENSISYVDFYTKEFCFLSVKKCLKLNQKYLIELCQNYIEKQDPRPIWVDSDKNQFLLAFQEIQKLIQAGLIQKAVPITSSISEKTLSTKQKAQVLLNLIQIDYPVHVYGFWSSDYGILGASPEVLYEINSERLNTMALAGTIKMDNNQMPIKFSDKEHKEHQFVVDDIYQQLSSYEEVEKSQTEVLKFPGLAHLITKFEVRSSGPLIAEKLVQELHPTPALGVYPRNFGYQWLSELPGQSYRGLLGSPIIFSFGENHSLALVAIRNIQWDKNKAWISVGCGVTRESDVEKEWQELYYKKMAVRKITGL